MLVVYYSWITKTFLVRQRFWELVLTQQQYGSFALEWGSDDIIRDLKINKLISCSHGISIKTSYRGWYLFHGREVWKVVKIILATQPERKQSRSSGNNEMIVLCTLECVFLWEADSILAGEGTSDSLTFGFRCASVVSNNEDFIFKQLQRSSSSGVWKFSVITNSDKRRKGKVGKERKQPLHSASINFRTEHNRFFD